MQNQSQSKNDHNARKYRNILHCLKTVYREEGIGALYIGLTTNLIRVVPAAAITLFAYEFILAKVESI